MSVLRRIMVLTILPLYSSFILAQTPIANRVKVAARSLPESASVIAKYTDNDRHSLYYTKENKIFCLDVVLNINEELDFTSHGYDKILATYISPGGEFMLFCIDKGQKDTNDILEERYELWQVNSNNRAFKCIASGFTIEKSKDGFTLRKKSKCLNPKAPKAQQRWMVRDHQFDHSGNPTLTQDEYEFKKKD